MNKGEQRGPLKEVWKAGLAEAIAGEGRVDFVGVGNELRGDDAVGLEIISCLRSRLRGSPRPRFRVHPVAPMPERLLSKLSSKAERIIIFDAVEAARPPGEIICSKLGETKYGFFATHNVPLRLVPGLEARGDEVYVVGVQPESLEVGEGLSGAIRDSVGKIVDAISRPKEVG
jgi:hydrogenase 3 maturation protease